jgi:transposase
MFWETTLFNPTFRLLFTPLCRPRRHSQRELVLKLINDLTWITRVPLSIKEAKEIVSNLAEDELISTKISGYSVREVESNYAGIKRGMWVIN